MEAGRQVGVWGMAVACETEPRLCWGVCGPGPGEVTGTCAIRWVFECRMRVVMKLGWKAGPAVDGASERLSRAYVLSGQGCVSV